MAITELSCVGEVQSQVLFSLDNLQGQLKDSWVSGMSPTTAKMRLD